MKCPTAKGEAIIKYLSFCKMNAYIYVSVCDKTAMIF